MQISEKSRIKRKKKCFKKIGKKTFILNEESDELLELNETAGLIWRQIEKTKDFSSLVHFLTEKFEVEKDKAKKDLKKIISLFKEKNLVTIENSS